MQEIHVSKFTATDKKKDGTPLTGKFGPFWRVSIQGVEFEGWASGLVNGAEKPEDWTGKVVSLDLYDEDFEGKTYKKFKIPKKGSLDAEKIDRILENTETILNRLVGFRIDTEIIKEAILPKKKQNAWETQDNTTAFDDEGPMTADDVPF